MSFTTLRGGIRRAASDHADPSERAPTRGCRFGGPYLWLPEAATRARGSESDYFTTLTKGENRGEAC